jgi:hypothetical protein
LLKHGNIVKFLLVNAIEVGWFATASKTAGPFVTVTTAAKWYSVLEAPKMGAFFVPFGGVKILTSL